MSTWTPGEKKAIGSFVLMNQNVHEQLQDTLDTRLATIRKRLEDSRADLAQNIDTLVEDSVDTREEMDVASKIRLYCSVRYGRYLNFGNEIFARVCKFMQIFLRKE